MDRRDFVRGVVLTGIAASIRGRMMAQKNDQSASPQQATSQQATSPHIDERSTG